MRKGPLFLVFLLALSLIMLPGCVSVPDLAGPGPAGKEVSGVSVNLVRSDADFSVSRGCFWTVTVQVYNHGEVEVRNVNVQLELVDATTGAVRDTMEVYAGTLAPGESRMIMAELDGDCINEYTLNAYPVLL
jgi:hypothetical protein